MGYRMTGGPRVRLRVKLDRVPEIARSLTGARYAALAVLNEQRTALERFLTAGVDQDTRQVIDQRPCGPGVLRELILDEHPLRLANIGLHPSSYGFPPTHPVMRRFLGVQVMIRGHAWASLHLADKAKGEFTEADELAVVALAGRAADAITFERRFHDNARVR